MTFLELCTCHFPLNHNDPIPLLCLPCPPSQLLTQGIEKARMVISWIRSQVSHGSNSRTQGLSGGKDRAGSFHSKSWFWASPQQWFLSKEYHRNSPRVEAHVVRRKWGATYSRGMQLHQTGCNPRETSRVSKSLCLMSFSRIAICQSLWPPPQ